MNPTNTPIAVGRAPRVLAVLCAPRGARTLAPTAPAPAAVTMLAIAHDEQIVADTVQALKARGADPLAGTIPAEEVRTERARQGR